MKILFLDFDGVICLSTEWGSRFKKKEGIDSLFDRFNDKTIKVLNHIIEETDCQIVVSSDWRFHAPLEQMQELFKLRGIKKVPIDYTPDFSSTLEKAAESRSWEILDWVKSHPDITHWVAVDDLDMSRHFNEGKYTFGFDNFVLTPRSKEGIKQCGIKEKIIKFLK